MIVEGIQLVLSTSEQGLFWDQDPWFADPLSIEKRDPSGVKAGFGIALKFRGGDVVYPSNQRLLKGTAWRKLCKWAVLPCLTVAVGKRGFYLGFKDFRADVTHAYLGLKDGDRALTPAVRFTRDRSK